MRDGDLIENGLNRLLMLGLLSLTAPDAPIALDIAALSLRRSHKPLRWGRKTVLQSGCCASFLLPPYRPKVRRSV